MRQASAHYAMFSRGVVAPAGGDCGPVVVDDVAAPADSHGPTDGALEEVVKSSDTTLEQARQAANVAERDQRRSLARARALVVRAIEYVRRVDKLLDQVVSFVSVKPS